MRWFLSLLMVLFLVNGYVSVAHAFSDHQDHPASTAAADGDCADSIKSSGEHKHGKGLCLDCHHCCAVHAVIMPAFTLAVQDVDSTLNPPPAITHAGRYPPSLLRPPKHA